MTSTGTGNLNPEPVARLVRNGKIVNRILASICGQENLSKIGVKAELQNRIIDKLYYYATSNDIVKFERLKAMIENPSIIPSNGQYVHVTGSPSRNVKNAANHVVTPSALLSPGNLHKNGFNDVMRGLNHLSTHTGQAIQFKPSPYYTFVEKLGATVRCDVMATHRFTAKISLPVNQYPSLKRISKEPNLRVMVFSSSEGKGSQDIAFPHQSELKVNGEEIKANLRGLKNKPGSTRPVDITGNIRFQPPGYINNIEMTYALTNKADNSETIANAYNIQRFFLSVFLTKTVPVPTLVQALANGKKITEKSIIAEMVTKARDTDIIATASVLSLKCPLSTIRIDLPCRSITCRHTQCFDAMSYLQLQEQGPTWSCPICNKAAPFETLAVDEYVMNILQKTSKSVEQVIIQPDGKWELNNKNEKPVKLKSSSNDSDDEVVEIIGTGTSKDPPRSKNSEASRISESVLIDSPRETTSNQSSSAITSCKRTIATIIDLTSSADEDEELPARPHKRQYTVSEYVTPTNVSKYRPTSTNHTLHKT